jgi:small subunit ribosomal protein S1
VDMYDQGDVIEGKVTKVVTFGAFIEVVPGVEGLVHISELAQHHVENPREVVTQGESVRARIIEMDPDRRRLSLSLKRVDEGEGGTGVGEGATELGLSEEVFAENMAEEPVAEEALAGPAAEEPVAEEGFAEEPPAEQSDESIEADSVAPEEQGPGDSEGGYPAPPEEDEAT